MNGNRISDLLLERYLLGEVTPAEQNRVRQVLDADSSVRDRLQRLEESGREILQAHPPEEMSRLIRRRLEGKENRLAGGMRFRPWPAFGGMAGLLLLAGLAWFFYPPAAPDGKISGPDIRVKGDPVRLLLYLKTPRGAELLVDGRVADQPAVVQMAYQVAEPGYAVILSLDGRQTVTRLYPESGPDAVPVKPGGPVPLDFSYELDDAPRGEVFFLVAAPRPFPVAAVVEAARKLDPDWERGRGFELQLPAGFWQTRFFLRKR